MKDTTQVLAKPGGLPILRLQYKCPGSVGALRGRTREVSPMSASKPSDPRDIQPVALAKVMGYKNARITLDIYAHLYDQHRTDDAIRGAMA